MMRTALYEAAQAMLMHSVKWSWLKAWAIKIARHRGRNKAIVALARRLAVIMPASGLMALSSAGAENLQASQGNIRRLTRPQLRTSAGAVEKGR